MSTTYSIQGDGRAGQAKHASNLKRAHWCMCHVVGIASATALVLHEYYGKYELYRALRVPSTKYILRTRMNLIQQLQVCLGFGRLKGHKR